MLSVIHGNGERNAPPDFWVALGLGIDYCQPSPVCRHGDTGRSCDQTGSSAPIAKVAPSQSTPVLQVHISKLTTVSKNRPSALK